MFKAILILSIIGLSFAGLLRDRSTVIAATLLSEEENHKTQSNIPNVPEYISILNINSASADLTYNGKLDLSRTGLRFAYNGQLLRDSILRLKTTNKKTKVLLTVTGNPTQWDHLNERGLVQLVNDLGIDGVNIVFQVSGEDTACNLQKNFLSKKVKCKSDAQLEEIIKRLNKALNKKQWLTLTVEGFAAYGVGKWEQSRPITASNGYAVEALRHRGGDLEAVFFNTFNIGNELNVEEAYAAIRDVYDGKVIANVMAPPEHVSGHELTIAELERILASSSKKKGNGISIEDITKNKLRGFINTEQIAQAACNALKLKGCQQKFNFY